MRIPNADQAIVDIVKLRDYCLNPQHPRGKHKARKFAAALGMEQSDAATLQKAILHAVATFDTAIEGEKDRFGARYVLDFEATGPTGIARIRTAWIVLDGERRPRLTSCYVLA